MSLANNTEFGNRNPRVHMQKDWLAEALRLPVSTVAGLGLVFAAVSFNLMSFNVDKDTVALDWQVLLKLLIIAGCGLYGAIGCITDSRVRQQLATFPCAWMALVSVFYTVAVVTSISPEHSLASGGSIVCILLATVTAIVQIGMRPVLMTTFVGMATFLFASWATYFMVPEIGVFNEPTATGGTVARMAGLSHSNTLGQFSSLTIILGLVMYVHYKIKTRVIPFVILVAFAALVCSLSRASMGSLIIALAVGYRHLFLQPKYYVYYWMAGLLGVLALAVLLAQSDVTQIIESRLSVVAKSGDADEITSATGRSEIWAAAIELIAERPLTGWGAATSKYLLADYSSYTHNMILNVALSTGIFGGLAMFLMCLHRVSMMRRRHHILADALVAYILVNGMVENVIFSPIAAMPTLIWIIGLCWWQFAGADDDATRTQPEIRFGKKLEPAGGLVR